ncbi:MAG TPA: hypothetical protein VII89_00190 [Candidatus Dormibacteraeota bacterium]
MSNGCDFAKSRHIPSLLRELAAKITHLGEIDVLDVVVVHERYSETMA